MGIRRNDHQTSATRLPVHTDIISDTSRLSPSIIIFPVNDDMLSAGANPSPASLQRPTSILLLEKHLDS